MLTSKELSEKLKNAGFVEESEFYYNQLGFNIKLHHIDDDISKKEKIFGVKYPAYDILNDLCVKYAKEVFGGGWIDDKKSKEFRDIKIEVSNYHSYKILSMLQQNTPQKEIEDYIFNNSILFK